MPVEASIEDLHDIRYEPSGESLQTDSKVAGSPSSLEEKLGRELQYHKHGSYNCEIQAGAAFNGFPHSGSSPAPLYLSSSAPDRPSTVSSVQSWTKTEPVQPVSQEGAGYHPGSAPCDCTLAPSHLPMTSSSSLPQFNQQHPHSHYDRQQSWPTFPVSDTSAPDVGPGRLLAPSNSKDPGTHRPSISSLERSGRFCQF